MSHGAIMEAITDPLLSHRYNKSKQPVSKQTLGLVFEDWSSGKYTLRNLAKKYDVHESNVSRWIDKHYRKLRPSHMTTTIVIRSKV